MALIDGHAHLSGDPEAVPALLNAMDAAGLARAVVVAGGTVAPLELARRIRVGGEYTTAVDNRRVLEQCATTAGRLIPFFFAEPTLGFSDYRRLGGQFHGLKLGPAVHGVPFSDSRMRALVGQAVAFRHPIYLHCLARPGFTVEDFVAMTLDFPTARFILGHGGIGNCDFEAVETIKPHTNISFETSGAFAGLVRYAVRRLGVERVIFGTEYPLQDPRVERVKADVLDLSPVGRAQFLGLNMAALLGETSPAGETGAATYA